MKKVRKVHPKKVYRQKTFAHSHKNKKIPLFCHVSVENFFARVFLELFNGFEINIKCCVDTHIVFMKKIFFVTLALLKTSNANSDETAQNTGKLFYINIS